MSHEDFWLCWLEVFSLYFFLGWWNANESLGTQWITWDPRHSPPQSCTAPLPANLKYFLLGMGYRLKVDNLHRELGLFTGLIFFTKTDTDILETRYLFSLSFSFKNATFGGGNDPVCPNCNCLCRLSTLRFSGGPATWGQDCLLCTGGQPVYNVGVSRMFQCVADVVVWSILNLASST